MACYTFTLGGKEFKVSSPNKGGETPLQNFINAINALKESDSFGYENIIALLKAQYSDSKVVKPDARQNRDIPYRIQANLKRYGIEMKVLSQQEWDQFIQSQNTGKQTQIASDAKAFFLNGEIYVKQDGFSVGDSIHELSHLILAVMKGLDFNHYKEFIHVMYQHPRVQEIAKSLENVGTYSNNYDLDFEEEAVVRHIEGLFTGEESFQTDFKYNGQKIDVAEFLNNNLKESIMKTFGITDYPGISTIFKSLVSDIPVFGSDMFVHRDVSSTGYKKMKQYAIESENIHALIDYYSSDAGGNRIIKGDCV